MTAHGKPKRKAADVACDRVRRAILDGEYPAGSTLPGERELSETLRVSRLTLRTALARLESEGLVRSEHGSGTRVLDYRASGGLDVLLHLAELEVETGAVPTGYLRDVLELRRIVAVELAGLIAERGSNDDLLALRRHLAKMREAMAESADTPAVQDRLMFEMDLGFARLLVRAGGNLALELLYNTIERFINATPAFRSMFMMQPETTLTAYTALLMLLEAGDGDAARQGAAQALAALDAQTLEQAASEAGARTINVDVGVTSH